MSSSEDPQPIDPRPAKAGGFSFAQPRDYGRPDRDGKQDSRTTWCLIGTRFFKFVRAALAGEAIDVYNQGNMSRDFTYVTDWVRAIRLLVDQPPVRPLVPEDIPKATALAPSPRSAR